MSKRTHLSTLAIWQQNDIKRVLLRNGWSQDDIDTMWYRLTIKDIDDIYDFDMMEV